jgi:DNA-binding transcriptional ArsR family regulator
VEELADEIDQSVANTSQHLQRLLRAGLVESRRDGKRIYYSLSGQVVADLWRTMRRGRDACRRAGEAGRRLPRRPVQAPCDHPRRPAGPAARWGRRRARRATRGGVRRRPHPGRDLGSLQDLKARLGELPDGADVVAYCRGPYCVYADEAVRPLDKFGVSAARLEDGFPEWAEARLPVVRTRTQLRSAVYPIVAWSPSIDAGGGASHDGVLDDRPAARSGA